MVNEYDANILQKILTQCNIMEVSVVKYKLSPEILADDGLLFNGVCETIFEIGELANKLSDEFKAAHPEQPWDKMYAMRNIIGHHYGKINLSLVWKTASERIPQLKKCCEDIMG